MMHLQRADELELRPIAAQVEQGMAPARSRPRRLLQALECPALPTIATLEVCKENDVVESPDDRSRIGGKVSVVLALRPFEGCIDFNQEWISAGNPAREQLAELGFGALV